MKTSARYALSITIAAAMLAACGGSQPPIGSLSTMPQSRAIARHAQRDGSWMLPEAKSGPLLYVSGSDLGRIYVFSLPGGKLVGTLTGFALPTGECVDAAGDVWIADTSLHGKVLEYAHGGANPIATLSVPKGYPMACSIDPKTGNLAVTSGMRTVSIYSGARGRPRSYSDDEMSSWYFCAYDDTGNLFLSGSSWRYVQRLVEQPYGKSRFETIAGIKGLAEDAPVVWDGKYVAVQAGNNQNIETIQRLKVVDRQALVEETVALPNSPPYNSQFLTFHGSLVQPAGVGAIGVWSYRRQGKLEKVIKQRNPEIQYQGVAVSVMPSH